MFKVTENGRQYKVQVRGAYLKTIRSEKKLRQVVDASFARLYGAELAKRKSLFEKCSLLGALNHCEPVHTYPKPLAQRIKERNQYFARGSGAYTCSECGKRTRETGSSESNLHLCKTCMQRLEQENLESDSQSIT